MFFELSCVFTNDLTSRAKYSKVTNVYKKTVVKEGVSIGVNAAIVCGYTMEGWAMIDAGATVTCDVPDRALMLVF